MGFLDELKRLTHPYEDEMEDDYDEDEDVYEDEDEPEERNQTPPPREREEPRRREYQELSLIHISLIRPSVRTGAPMVYGGFAWT